MLKKMIATPIKTQVVLNITPNMLSNFFANEFRLNSLYFRTGPFDKSMWKIEFISQSAKFLFVN